MYVAFLQFQGGFGSTLPHSGVWVAKSTDGGETFTQVKVADIRQHRDRVLGHRGTPLLVSVIVIGNASLPITVVGWTSLASMSASVAP